MTKRFLTTTAGLVAVIILLTSSLSQPAQAGTRTVIVINDTPFPCTILKHDEKSISVFLTEVGVPTEIPWDKLSRIERNRLKKLLNISTQTTRGPQGLKIDGIEVKTRRGTYVGIELKDRSNKDFLAMRCPNTPLWTIPRDSIISVKAKKVWSGTIFTPGERLRLKKAKVNPTTAQDFYKMAVWCSENELFPEAVDYAAKAEIVNPDLVEQTKELRTKIAELKKKADARKIYSLYLKAVASNSISRALKLLATLESDYPDFEQLTSELKKKPFLEKRRTKTQRREVVSLYYRYMDEFVRRCVTKKTSDTPPVPITIVHLRSGSTISGNLQGGADGDKITLLIEGRKYEIERKHVERVETKMLNKGPFRPRTLAECKAYSTATKGGIVADIENAISKDVSIPVKQVGEIWKKRLSDAIKVTVGREDSKAQIATYHDAHYSTGSWLRSGGSASGGGVVMGGTSGGTSRTGRTTGGNSNGNKKNPNDDPETWWAKQSLSLRGQILKAMCAEAIMKVEKVYKERCSHCTGDGLNTILSSTGSGTMRRQVPCRACRGAGFFWGVSYR
jgi:hypothetical protein